MTFASAAQREVSSQSDRLPLHGQRHHIAPTTSSVLDSLYREQRPAVLAYLVRRVGQQDAPDLMHEVFLRAAASQQLGELVNPRAFLCRIAQTVLIDRARREQRRPRPLPLLGDVDARCPATQEDSLLEAAVEAELNRVLASLSPRTREIFRLHRFEGQTYRQIHERLGISVAGVEFHMMKALARLRLAFGSNRSSLTPTISQRAPGKNNCT